MGAEMKLWAVVLAMTLLSVVLVLWMASRVRALAKSQRGTHQEVRRLRRRQDATREEVREVRASVDGTHDSLDVLMRVVREQEKYMRPPRPAPDADELEVQLERVDWLRER